MSSWTTAYLEGEEVVARIGLDVSERHNEGVGCLLVVDLSARWVRRVQVGEHRRNARQDEMVVAVGVVHPVASSECQVPV